MSEIYYGMDGVEDLIKDIIDHGVWVENERTGTKTKALFDAKILINDGEFPFVTNMTASPRMAFEEFWFFLNGRTNTKELEEKGIFFWKGNTSRDFLDANGFNYLDEGELGSAYSPQFRNFGGYDEIYAQDYGKSQQHTSYNGGVDQLKNLFNNLKKDRYSRRHLITLWNPQENEFGVLTPCWHSSQYVVLPDGKGNDILNIKLINRSLDTLFGARFAIQQYRMFQMALCKAFGFKIGDLSCDLSHIHLYENQIEYAKELLTRNYAEEGEVNYLELNKDINSLEDLLSINWKDWDMLYNHNKDPFKTPRPKMVA